MKLYYLKIQLLVAMLVISSQPSSAEVPIDGYYEIDSPSSSVLHPYFILENGSVTGGSGFMFNPVCKDGQISSPAFAMDLNAFFEGYPVNRVIDKGDGKYLLTSSIAFDQNDQFQNISAGTLTAVYAELDFATSVEGTFTIRVASAFFTGEGMGTSTCLAKADYGIYRVNN